MNEFSQLLVIFITNVHLQAFGKKGEWHQPMDYITKKLAFFREMKFSELKVIKNIIKYSEDLINIGLCSEMVDWIIHRHAGIGQEISEPTEF